MQIMKRFLLLSFLVLVLGFNSGCGSDGTGTGAGGTGGAGAPPPPLAIVYVDASATGNNDGKSWDNAFTDLQAGINAAASKVSGNGYVRVHVAQGTYKPTSCPDQANGECAAGADSDRNKHFALKNGVSVYGGYKKGDDGTYTVVEDATKDDDKTILSGDIGTAADTDNVYHVFYHPNGTNLDDTAKLSNVTISGGNADGTTSHYSGGGMYNGGSSPKLTSVTFTHNAASLHGGGMYNNNSSPNLTNVNFTSNTATASGGGMSNESSSPTLTGVTFSHNTATGDGGGMYSTSTNSRPVLNGVTFSHNTANRGGGLAMKEGSGTLTDCIFKNNKATNSGGGMFNQHRIHNDATDNTTLTRVTFTSNEATNNGGGLYVKDGATPELNTVTFEDNKVTGTDGTGGAIYIGENSDLYNSQDIKDGQENPIIPTTAEASKTNGYYKEPATP